MNSKDLVAWFKKHPFPTICGVLTVLLLGGYFFRQGAVPEAESSLQEKMSESRRLKANIANAASLKDHVATLEEANRKVEGRLMRAADLAKNQQYFYKIEAETGVKLTDLRPGASLAKPKAPGAAKKLYSSVPYTCGVQGTYEQLLAFLRRLEEGEHFQRITNASVSMGGSGSADDAASADPILSLSIGIEFLGES